MDTRQQRLNLLGLYFTFCGLSTEIHKGVQEMDIETVQSCLDPVIVLRTLG